jgi:hypothetical protein
MRTHMHIDTDIHTLYNRARNMGAFEEVVGPSDPSTAYRAR